MTKTEPKTATAAVKEILLENPDGPREMFRSVVQEMLEAEMDEALGAAKSGRSPERVAVQPCRQRIIAQAISSAALQKTRATMPVCAAAGRRAGGI